MANWDETNPGDNDIVSQFPGNERSARGAVKTNFGIDHEEDQTSSELGFHKAVTLIDNIGDVVAVVDTCILYGKAVSGVTEAFMRFEGGAILQVTEGGKIRSEAVALIPVGTNMVFNQASAPTGWTQDTSVNDRVLRVVDTAGAVNGGSWTISGISVDGHALTVDEMPVHDHDYTVVGGGTGIESGAEYGQPSVKTSTAGGGQPHNHGVTFTPGWRPAYRNIIAATLD